MGIDVSTRRGGQTKTGWDSRTIHVSQSLCSFITADGSKRVYTHVCFLYLWFLLSNTKLNYFMKLFDFPCVCHVLIKRVEWR